MAIATAAAVTQAQSIVVLTALAAAVLLAATLWSRLGKAPAKLFRVLVVLWAPVVGLCIKAEGRWNSFATVAVGSAGSVKLINAFGVEVASVPVVALAQAESVDVDGDGPFLELPAGHGKKHRSLHAGSEALAGLQALAGQ